VGREEVKRQRKKAKARVLWMPSEAFRARTAKELSNYASYGKMTGNKKTASEKSKRGLASAP